MRVSSCPLYALAILGVLVAIPSAAAKDKKAKPANDPKDEIQVVGHIDVTGGGVTNFLITPHYSSWYLYAERGAGKPVLLIDVTKPEKPAILGDMAYSSNGSDSLTLVAGTAALVGTAPTVAQTANGAPQTIRVMDFSDPRNPKVAREFTGIAAMAMDARRGLIFLADANGIWILRQKLATDPEIEKEYANYVLYSH